MDLFVTIFGYLVMAFGFIVGAMGVIAVLAMVGIYIAAILGYDVEHRKGGE